MAQRTRYDFAWWEPVSQAELSEDHEELLDELERELSRLVELHEDIEAELCDELEKELELEDDRDEEEDAMA